MVDALGSVVAISAVAGALVLGFAATSPVPGAGAGVRTGTDSTAQRSRSTTVYALPLPNGPAVVHPFDAPDSPYAAGHRGVDLAGAVGQNVLAPASGSVTFAGTLVDRGVLTIRHPDGLRSSLEPVVWSVAAGEHVVQGQIVGTVQPLAGHCAPASCLHWGVRRGDLYLDPLALLTGTGPVILLPDP